MNMNNFNYTVTPSGDVVDQSAGLGSMMMNVPHTLSNASVPVVGRGGHNNAGNVGGEREAAAALVRLMSRIQSSGRSGGESVETTDKSVSGADNRDGGAESGPFDLLLRAVETLETAKVNSNGSTQEVVPTGQDVLNVSEGIGNPFTPSFPGERPPGFQDPPESEWITVCIHQVDPFDGSIRYNCRNVSTQGTLERPAKKPKLANTGERALQCLQCDSKFVTMQQLKEHSRRHEISKTRGCPYCEKRFLSPNELGRHKVTAHPLALPCVCLICYQRFPDGVQYNVHLQTFHKTYDCKDCCVKVSSASGLTPDRTTQ